MKNNELKSQDKSARKAAAKDIEQSLIATLKEVAVKLKQDAEDFSKAIEKGAKKLAKKLAKEIAFDKPFKSEAVAKVKAADKTEKPKTAVNSKATAAPVKAAPAAKKVVEKPSPAPTSPVKKAAGKTVVKGN
jgi:hypothetical protein